MLCGFCDTLRLLKTIVPHQHSQEAQFWILNEKYVAHDALVDSRYLQKLVKTLENDVDPHNLSCTFNVQYVFYVLGLYPLSQENFMSIHVRLTEVNAFQKTWLRK